jgi:hypothetical protein
LCKWDGKEKGTVMKGEWKVGNESGNWKREPGMEVSREAGSDGAIELL